ncbi:MAG: NAD-dependent epimerase/dehydratase family protein [Epsilonproteobacteria bacterium]|nr:NAD-dependent epimerase/dehydratase family protein [Campylobacterota bacterium]
MKQFEQFYQGKEVLVTGGAGFIGSHLVEKLVQLGAKVSVLDNFSTGKLGNLTSVASYISLLCSDVRSAYSCIKATVNKQIVFHLASFVSVPESINNPSLCHQINVQGTQNLLEGCKKNNVGTVVFASSSAVYGNAKKQCHENDTPSPQSPYAQSKLDGETLCREYGQAYNINTACLRYFNVYGERQDPTGTYAAVVAKFRQQLLSKQPITIFGDGTQTRDFINVADVVNANLKIGMLQGTRGEVFNIGSGRSITLLQLLEQLEQELNIKRSDVLFQPARRGDVIHSQANCEKYTKIQI